MSLFDKIFTPDYSTPDYWPIPIYFDPEYEEREFQSRRWEFLFTEQAKKLDEISKKLDRLVDAIERKEA